MAGRKNGNKAVAERRAQVAKLHRQGMFQTDIAAALGVVQSQISADLKYLNAQWKREQVEFIDLQKQHQLSDIRRTIVDADESFNRSRASVVTLSDGSRAAILDRRTTIAGDPRFLELRLKAVEREAKLLGTEAATKNELTGKDGAPLQSGVTLVIGGEETKL